MKKKIQNLDIILLNSEIVPGILFITGKILLNHSQHPLLTMIKMDITVRLIWMGYWLNPSQTEEGILFFTKKTAIFSVLCQTNQKK